MIRTITQNNVKNNSQKTCESHLFFVSTHTHTHTHTPSTNFTRPPSQSFFHRKRTEYQFILSSTTFF
ncbi:MAG: hypothetical protein LBR17_06670, partial [Bacteroidales bacterium]|nr:hypothetical protein [Bacteroidales bacterium]